jgi:hypothetical protein
MTAILFNSQGLLAGSRLKELQGIIVNARDCDLL